MTKLPCQILASPLGTERVEEPRLIRSTRGPQSLGVSNLRLRVFPGDDEVLYVSSSGPRLRIDAEDRRLPQAMEGNRPSRQVVVLSLYSLLKTKRETSVVVQKWNNKDRDGSRRVFIKTGFTAGGNSKII